MSRLKQHLARIFGKVTYCKKAPEKVCMKMKENLEGYRASKQQQSEDEEQSFDLHSTGDNEEDEKLVGYICKGRQVGDDQSMVTAIAPLPSLGEFAYCKKAPEEV
ncbi:putative Zinc finger protein [Cocos nucifera]|nr:putative Zinc finger protein [Cocos nucifera]